MILFGGQMKRKALIIGSAAVIAAVAVYLVFTINKYYPFKKLLGIHPKAQFSMGDNGTADRLDGKTVCVSLYMYGEKQTWAGCDDKKEKYRENLGMAASWLADRAGEYGRTAEFVWDWSQYPELCIDVTEPRLDFASYYANNDGDNKLWKFIDEEVPSAELVEKFGADNIIYIAFFNTPDKVGTTSYAQDSYFDRDYSYDVVFLSAGNSGHEATATTLAHEILHLYGAPDLYKTGSPGTCSYGLRPRVLDFIKENYPDEIMQNTYDRKNKQPYYGETHGVISPVTAYYAGLTDEVPQIILDCGADLSSHDPNRDDTNNS